MKHWIAFVLYWFIIYWLCTQVVSQWKVLNSCLFSGKPIFPRGKGYYHSALIDVIGMEDDSWCKVTGWNLSHFLVHFIAGFLFPEFVFLSLAIGILFEIYEQTFFHCHDGMDLLMNWLGLFLGYYFGTRPQSKNIFRNSETNL